MSLRQLFACLAIGVCLLAGVAHAAPPKLVVLNSADAGRYKRIFELQDKGDFKSADKLIRQLKDDILLGHVQFQRYMHPTDYRTNYKELSAWLDRYNDHPEAFRAFALAIKRSPRGAPEPKRPVYGEVHILALVGEAPAKPMPFIGEQERLARQIRALVRKGDNAGALRALRSEQAQRAMSARQQDALAAHVAMGYFVDGDDKSAYGIASAAANRSGRSVGQAHWVTHFEATAVAPGATSWTAAAGAFWAGRIHLALRQVGKARAWLEKAARHDHTFYGQLALHALEAGSPFNWRAPEATSADIARLRGLKAGRRALALLQIREYWRADQELQPLVDDADQATLRSILAIAQSYSAPRASIQAAHRLNRRGGGYSAPGHFPIPPWNAPKSQPVDRALLYAFMRQQSQFNPRAASPAGARGLMQVLPSTANYILGQDRYVKAYRDGLFDPEQSVAVGARYIRYLLRKKQVGNGLFRLAIAYNAGIGNLIRWQKTIKDNDDPLLFIEALPSRETRVFVERVLANYWIYRDRLGQRAPSREDVAQGRWPIYKRQE